MPQQEGAPGPQQLQRRLAALHALLSNIPDPVILVDGHAFLREANEAARVLLPTLRLDQPLSYAVRAPEILSGVETVLRTGQPLRVEYHQRFPTERMFDVQIGALASGGAVERDQPGVMLFFRDLTAARRLEQVRVDFVANVSHELRTPLASLLGFIDTLQGSAREDAGARDRFLGIMREQALRMTRLIEDLLSLSRIELRAHIAPKDLVELGPLASQVIDTLSAMARERDVEIVLTEQAGTPSTVLGERDELLRVVENLVENAVKYGESGGRVDVTLRRSESAPGSVELCVRDYGPGIGPEHLPRLTERFYRVDVAQSRQKGGTGLGLAIVKHIVNRHGARLTIESEPGRGAAFRVVFPARVRPQDGR